MTRLRQFTSVLAAFSVVAGCGSSSPPAPSVSQTGPGIRGGYTSVAVGSDRLGLISYQELISLEPSVVSNLKVAHCEDSACTRAIRTVVDSDDAGWYTSVAIGSDGLGLISYTARLDNLRVAHCENVACTTALVSTINREVGGIAYTALAIGRDGHGLISYREVFGGDLRVAHCEDTACTSATVSTLEHLLDPGESSAIAIGSDGLGLIAYNDRHLSLLKVAHCRDTPCTSATLSTIDSPALAGRGVDPHIAIGVDGLGLISYTDGEAGGNLKVAHCSDVQCSQADVITFVDREGPHGRVGQYSSVTTGRDGLGLIGSRGSTSDFVSEDLRVAHCQDVACRSAVVNTLDSDAGGSGPFTSSFTTSVVIGADGLGLIGYAAGTLKVAHCQNAPCTSATLTILD